MMLKLKPSQNLANFSHSPMSSIFRNEVLQLSDGIEDLDGVKWDLFGTFLFTWFLVFLCLCKGSLVAEVVFFLLLI